MWLQSLHFCLHMFNLTPVAIAGCPKQLKLQLKMRQAINLHGNASKPRMFIMAGCTHEVSLHHPGFDSSFHMDLISNAAMSLNAMVLPWLTKKTSAAALVPFAPL